MDSNGSNTVPTASVGMLQSKGLNGGPFGNDKHFQRNEHGRRHRSKSEGDYLSDGFRSEGMIVKSVKDKANDRKPRNLKGRGQPKKGSVYCYGATFLLCCYDLRKQT